MDLKSKHSYQTQSFLWLLGFSWLLIVCFVGFQYHREKELRTELLDSQLQIINAQLEEALYTVSLCETYNLLSLVFQKLSFCTYS